MKPTYVADISIVILLVLPALWTSLLHLPEHIVQVTYLMKERSKGSAGGVGRLPHRHQTSFKVGRWTAPVVEASSHDAHTRTRI